MSAPRLLTESDAREIAGLFARLKLLRGRAEWPTPQLKREILAAETRLEALRFDPGVTVWAKAAATDPEPA